MINFEQRVGPVFDPPVEYPDATVAKWWRDAKFGIFIHWGLYSVPAWAEIPVEGEYIGPEQAYARHSYGEWIANTVRIAGSGASRYVAEKYGYGFAYEDFADLFHAQDFDAAAIATACAAAGARYLIPTTKHHDGYCLWDTQTTPFNSAKRGPKRDLIQEFSQAARAAGMKFGTYYSGALDWHVTDFPPIESNRDLFKFRNNSAEFSQYCAAQFHELVEKYQPDIFWNDIEWPDAAKGHSKDANYSLQSLLSDYFRQVPEGVINDRFGAPVHGHLTREYSLMNEVETTPWEATRGLGHSFGYNQNESIDSVLCPDEAIRLLTHVVARGGNLLLNVGLDANGVIPPVYQQTLDGIGAWIKEHGQAVYGTAPDRSWGEPTETWALVAREGHQFLYLPKPSEPIYLPAAAAGCSFSTLAGDPVSLDEDTLLLELPPKLRDYPVAVLEVGKEA